MTITKVDQIRALLKSIETGETAPVAVVNEAKYVQHNPQTQEGSEGLANLFKRLSQTHPKVNMVRGFQDGDYVFAHMEYDFASRKICFEVFRFEDGQAVEHWDNIQPRQTPNASGHSMVDGPTSATNHAETERNRACVRTFVEEVLIAGRLDRLNDFIDADRFAEHNPHLEDGITALNAALSVHTNGEKHIDYQRLHFVLAEGNFVLSASEGRKAGVLTAFYDLFRIECGKLVEHWDTTEAIAPIGEWKNHNGKF